ncbi:M14 family metallopeptidase [Stygiobacter electus]|uniref:M14 family metallopeptidase n=1 Tax=Stygiobacter electus TaxID=3032292 RepID=A0AAE3P1W7_9BACT|nr:M14 family metallopeptidase [Stygiobacter electus]MDF1612814.1 M14 family metallopeptidase [Stygiobacter electus]
MNLSFSIKTLILILSLISTQINLSQSLKSPEEFLGYKVGTDYKIADYETITKYFKHLSENSNKILFQNIGKTSQGRDMFMSIISSEDNLKNIDKYKDIIHQLSDPRKTNEAEAIQLAKDGKIIVMVTCNIHSNEIASAQMSIEFAYDLVRGKASEKSMQALNDVIFVLVPSLNPDGTTMIVNWYNKYLGTEFEGSQLPYLYHIYSGHDNNRDWFMFNLKETQNVIKVAFHDLIPQIWLDEHQMGSTGARLFVVPYKDPINPNVNPLIWRWQTIIGGMSALDLQKQNKTGIITQALFEGWWEGPASDCGLWHNQIALLSEMASCNIASPIYIDSAEVRVNPELATYDIRTNYVSPWRGGWWRLRDIVDYELGLTFSLLETAASYKTDLLLNYYKMAKEAIEDGKKGNPFAYVIPRDQKDPQTTSKMIEMLQFGAVEVNWTDKEFKLGNTIYPANSYVIYLAQPNGKYVKDLFEEQRYPDLRKSRSETPIRPYDVAGWTLPYLMGVKFYTIEKPFELETKILTHPNYYEGSVENSNGNYFVSPSGLNVNSALINKLQKQNIPVYWNSKQIDQFQEGSVFIPMNENSKKAINELAKEFHLKIYSANVKEQSLLKELKKVRVALYQPYTANMDEGWTRLLLENYQFDFKNIYNKDFKNKKLKDLYDVIIIPDMSGDLIKNGKPSGDNARFYRPKPAEYEGGIEKEGVENLKTFVEKDGGYLITLGQACNFAIEDLGLKVTNVLKNVKADDFYCPGSLVRMTVNNQHPIGYGFDNEVIGYLSDNIAFSTTVPYADYDRNVIVRYPTSNILKSGFLLGEDYLYRRSAIVDVKQKKGHVILLGFKVQNRHQTFGTFKFLFNAIHNAGINN